MIKIKKRRKVIIVAILFGAFGTVLFCPIKMQSGGTCLFHRFVGNDTQYIPDNIPRMEKANMMLRRYLVPFGFVWWFSLGLFVLSIYQLNALKNKSKEHV